MFSMVDLPATKSGRRHLFVSSNWKCWQLMSHHWLMCCFVPSLESR
jgi:hypothetical protein